jgi:hypothetical protein
VVLDDVPTLATPGLFELPPHAATSTPLAIAAAAIRHARRCLPH